MHILGIETSCDETSAAIIRIEGSRIEVLSNTVSSQIPVHAPYGGVVPSLAAREHAANLPVVVSQALKEARLQMEDIGLISVTSGPGLISSLLVGTGYAKALAWKHGKDIVGVNHMEGHIYSNWLKPKNESSEFSTILFPILNLIVSGGHTQLVLMEDHGTYRLLGETRDDAAGEAFDKIARILNLGYPGGPAISKAAEKGRSERFALPRPMFASGDYDFSFSGLKTAVLYLVRNLTLDPQTVADVAASAQEAIVDVLVAKTLAAAQEHSVRTVMLSGGVSANTLLREQLTEGVGKLSDVAVQLPPLTYTTDNAAMIALAGYFTYLKEGPKPWTEVRADANWEIV